MDNVIKFSKIGAKRRFVQFLFVILFSLLVLFLFSRFLQNRRESKIKAYSDQIEKLQSERQEKIQAIEKEYDEKIKELLTQMKKIKE